MKLPEVQRTGSVLVCMTTYLFFFLTRRVNSFWHLIISDRKTILDLFSLGYIIINQSTVAATALPQSFIFLTLLLTVLAYEMSATADRQLPFLYLPKNKCFFDGASFGQKLIITGAINQTPQIFHLLFLG